MNENLPTVEGLVADPGITIHPGPITTHPTESDTDSTNLDTNSTNLDADSAEASSDPSTLSSTTHHIDSVTYIDAGGHLHAVLIDTVVTSTGFRHTTTIEILKDVTIS